MNSEHTILQKLGALRFTPLMGLLQHAVTGLFCLAFGRWLLSDPMGFALETNAVRLLHLDRAAAAILFLLAAYCAFQTVVLAGVVGWEAWKASQRHKAV